ncbi:hypothetical protein PL78_03730 [Yersinia entomophaga]|uniref:Yen6 n=1 Tax=Yersinia entomophaga TaxID=935293 RepID=B6A874_YERET|nr:MULTISPECIES: hypothetical protein [Yersinia]ABG33872.1 Yen6 [Yersinia entomophaga]ANI28950.1 hypothetical protein PL78_03730 [Yersinia entomophaga]OWF88821.1 hypothetical protein B4914_06355 [Yersinia entomophaga]
MSGFVDFKLVHSGAPVTISKTAILYVEENTREANVTNLHCVGSITHVVSATYAEVRKKLPKFIETKRSDNGTPKVALHDWNVSYIEKSSSGTAIVYFTEQGLSVPVAEPYENIIKIFHAI